MIVPAGGQSTDQRFTAGLLIHRNATLGLYAVRLTIDPVPWEDDVEPLLLRLENSVDVTELEFRLDISAPPPLEGLTDAAVRGTVAAAAGIPCAPCVC